MPTRILKIATIALALPLALSACGGGDDAAPCSSTTVLSVGFAYTTPLISSGGSSVIAYKPGEAFTSSPNISGVPESCDAGKRFSLQRQPGNFGVDLPASVSLDPATGTLAGTLPVPLGRCNNGSTSTENTTNPACAGGGSFAKAYFDVTLTLPGYSPLTKQLSFTPRAN